MAERLGADTGGSAGDYFDIGDVGGSCVFRVVQAMREMVKLDCAWNLRQDGLAIRVWAEDHNGHRPQNVSVKDGGARELIDVGNVAGFFQIMSNELTTPKLLNCPLATQYSEVTNFPELKNPNVTYFTCLNPDDSASDAIMFGDDNLVTGDRAVESGVYLLWTNRMARWSEKRHRLCGNIACFDGSTVSMGNQGLAGFLTKAGMATNWVAIP